MCLLVKKVLNLTLSVTYIKVKMYLKINIWADQAKNQLINQINYLDL